MIPKQENMQFMESILPSLPYKSKDSSCYDSVDFFQPEDSSIKTENYNNVIPFKLKTSRKVYTRKSLYEAVKKKLSLSGKDWEEMVKLMNNHPPVKQMAGQDG